MSELIAQYKKIRLYKEKISFEQRYRHCNRRYEELHFDEDEEIVCALRGETFCNSCINKH